MFQHSRGFTLIELIVVITLISVMMFFAVPRLNTNLLSSDKRKVSKWLVLTVKTLKENAVRRQARHILHVDFDNHKFWTSVDTPESADMPEMDELAEMSEKKQNEFQLPDGYRLLDVEYPEDQRESSGVAEIRFFKKGYSDHAMIHVEDADADRITYEVQPFLLEVQIHEDHAAF
ncbi:MAG TPA: type II secretion system protein [Desulfosalsimonadaceae bacterium]|nr:type II secretion system protein [Desulfosalsimonadaceae bacterium]